VQVSERQRAREIEGGAGGSMHARPGVQERECRKGGAIERGREQEREREREIQR